MNILNKNKNWTSKTELMINLDINSDTIDQIISEFSIHLLFQVVLNGIKKGGYHNLETYYDDFLVAVIKAKAKYYTNQNTNATKEAKELGNLLNTVINSGDLKAARNLCDLIMEKIQIQSENKKMSEQTKQIDKEIERLTDLLYNCKS